MKRTFIKIITIIFLAVFANISALAIDSEFKNTLTNVDLVKTSQNSYTVNLYTSKKYAAPIKVIKKSDLSYYILLPETKNIAPKVNLSFSDIRNVSATLYPYAGVDVNNGYTKVDITTTRPIVFNVVTKSSTQQVASNTQTTKETTVAQKQTQTTNTQAKTQTQKENTNKTATTQKATNTTPTQKATTATPKKELVASAPKASISAKDDIKNTKNNIQKNTKDSEKISSNDTAAKNTVKKDTVKKEDLKKAEKTATTKVQTTSKNAKTTSKKDTELVASKKIEEKLKKISSQQSKKTRVKEETEPAQAKEETDVEAMAAAKIEAPIPGPQPEIVEEEPLAEAEIEQAPVEVEQAPQEKNVVSKDINLAPIGEKIGAMFSGIGSAFSKGFSAISGKLYEYGISFFDLMFMIFAGIFSFIAVLFIISKRQNQTVALKKKSDLVEEKEPPLVAKKETTDNKDDGKYFVFENNVKQTELTVPAENTEKKNYELVSYDPEIRINPNKSNEDNNEDLDIIQKILKDEDFIDIQKETDSVDNTPVEPAITVGAEDTSDKEQVMLKEEVKTETIVDEPIKEPIAESVEEQIKQNESVSVTSPIGMEHVQPVQKEEIAPAAQTEEEPKLLASYNISPERGFMFISYNNNVSLMGFIFDDVFKLYNYKASELSNYTLQFRLVDKDAKNDVYIVKTEAVKLLVKVSRTSMNTEIIL